MANISGTSRRVAAVWLVVLMVATALVFTATAASSESRPVRVMTRNLYLGADLTPALQAQNPVEAGLAAAQIYATVQATNFPERAKSLAYEVLEADPDVIGLQEVALWRTGPPDQFLSPEFQTPAEDVAFDFLENLLNELNALGLDYEAAVVQKEADIEATALDPSIGPFLDIRLTQRDVILVRADAPTEVAWSKAAKANFLPEHQLVLETVLGPIEVTRGWTSLDVVVNKRAFRFVNTHLEAFDLCVFDQEQECLLRLAQTSEILAGPAATELPVILVGDLNSGPHDEFFADSWDFLVGGRLFDDAWVMANGDAPGFTCCQAEDLLNPASQLGERIDHILTSRGMAVDKAKIVGNDQDNRTPSGMWPSDHSGMVAALAP